MFWRWCISIICRMAPPKIWLVWDLDRMEDEAFWPLMEYVEYWATPTPPVSKESQIATWVTSRGSTRMSKSSTAPWTHAVPGLVTFPPWITCKKKGDGWANSGVLCHIWIGRVRPQVQNRMNKCSIERTPRTTRWVCQHGHIGTQKDDKALWWWRGCCRCCRRRCIQGSRSGFKGHLVTAHGMSKDAQSCALDKEFATHVVVSKSKRKMWQPRLCPVVDYTVETLYQAAHSFKQNLREKNMNSAITNWNQPLPTVSCGRRRTRTIMRMMMWKSREQRNGQRHCGRIGSSDCIWGVYYAEAAYQVPCHGELCANCWLCRRIANPGSQDIIAVFFWFLFVCFGCRSTSLAC